MLFSTFELTKRILICYLGWFVGNLYYYVIGEILILKQIYCELRLSIISFSFIFVTSNHCFFTMFSALNGTNFTVNEYLYVGLNGVCEIPGYTILPLVILTYYGRRSAGIALFTVSGVAVLAIMFIPQGSY